MFQQRDELEHIGESFTEACILDLILKGLSGEFEPIRFVAERDPGTLLKKSRPQCATCTPTTSRVVTARVFRAGRDVSRL